MTNLDTLISRVRELNGPDELSNLNRAEERFWSMVDSSAGANSCWPWLGSDRGKGYGQMSVGSRGAAKNYMAHRLAYYFSNGPIPEGLVIDHTCRNRACCNPSHLEPVTTAENNRRAYSWREECFRGHRFTPENTIVVRGGTRECRACRLERKRIYRTRARLALTAIKERDA